MYEKLWSLRKQLQHSHNLIHCITNPISMNDCANAVLALGAKPIMAQHPMECEQITACSKALALNLGNFDDSRAIAMKKSLHCANENGIPRCHADRHNDAGGYSAVYPYQYHLLCIKCYLYPFTAGSLCFGIQC